MTIIHKFFEYPNNRFLEWFDNMTVNETVKWLKTDFDLYYKENYKISYHLIPQKRLTKKMLQGFLDSGYSRLQLWFQEDSGLWERFKEIMLNDFYGYLSRRG